MPYQKGQSGNPAGRPPYREEDRAYLKDMCKAYTARSFQVLMNIIENEDAKDQARITAVRIVLEYGWGKPAQEIRIEDKRSDGSLTNMTSQGLLQLIKREKVDDNKEKETDES